MSELIEGFGPTPDVTEVAEAPRQASRRPSILITVQHLLFGSASALAPRPQRSGPRVEMSLHATAISNTPGWAAKWTGCDTGADMITNLSIIWPRLAYCSAIRGSGQAGWRRWRCANDWSLRVTFGAAARRRGGHRIDRSHRAAGIVTAGGTLHEIDLLVLATGFDARAYVRPMQIIGEDGITSTRPGPTARRRTARSRCRGSPTCSC